MTWTDADVATNGWSDEDVAPKRSLPQALARQGGMTGRLAANILTSPFQVGGDMLNKGINALGGNLEMPSVIISRQLDRVFPKPEGAIENLTQEVGKGAVGMALPSNLPMQIAGNAIIGGALAPEGKEVSGTAMGAVGGAAPTVLSKTLGGAAKQIFGTTSGTGAEPITQAYRAGKEGLPDFTANMRGEVEPAVVVQQARSGLGNMRQQMMTEYKSAKNSWANDQTPLSFSGIGQAYNDALNKFSYRGITKPAVTEVRDGIESVMNDWLTRAQSDPHLLTTEGLDALKQHVATIMPSNPANREGRAFVSEVTRAIKKTITDQKPEYAAAMKDYWKRSEQLEEIEKSLSLGDKASVDTALRKLTSLMRNNANTNYGQRLKSAQALATQGGEDILPAVAGQAMNSWTPRGLQSLAGTGAGIAGVVSSPSAFATLPAFSPRVVGEVAHGLGVASRYAGNKLPPDSMEAMIAAEMRRRQEQGQ